MCLPFLRAIVSALHSLTPFIHGGRRENLSINSTRTICLAQKEMYPTSVQCTVAFPQDGLSLALSLHMIHLSHYSHSIVRPIPRVYGIVPVLRIVTQSHHIIHRNAYLC